MMVANSANLIVTVKPVNQHNNISARGGISSARSSAKSMASYASARSHFSTHDFGNEKTRVADSDDDVVKSYLTSASEQTAATGENVMATV